MDCRPLLIAVVAISGSAAAASAQPPPVDIPADVRTALARPVTPAATALLLPHTAPRAVVERLADGLRDANRKSAPLPLAWRSPPGTKGCSQR